jgi:hypothetical protein
MSVNSIAEIAPLSLTTYNNSDVKDVPEDSSHSPLFKGKKLSIDG